MGESNGQEVHTSCAVSSQEASCPRDVARWETCAPVALKTLSTPSRSRHSRQAHVKLLGDALPGTWAPGLIDGLWCNTGRVVAVRSFLAELECGPKLVQGMVSGDKRCASYNTHFDGPVLVWRHGQRGNAPYDSGFVCRSPHQRVVKASRCGCDN